MNIKIVFTVILMVLMKYCCAQKQAISKENNRRYSLDSIQKMRYMDFFDEDYILDYKKLIEYRKFEDSIPEGIKRRKYYDNLTLLESYLGNYFDALEFNDRKFEQPTEMVSFDSLGNMTKGIHYPPKIIYESPDSLFERKYKSIDYYKFLKELPSDNKVFALNENHIAAIGRSILYNSLIILKNKGYTHLVLETLFVEKQLEINSKNESLRNYGFFNGEVNMGNVIRRAKKLGYKIVAYDAQKAGNQKKREEQSFQNIISETFDKQPDAKLILFAGSSHIGESEVGGIKSLGLKFKEIGIDPITVAQDRYLEKGAMSTILSPTIMIPKNKQLIGGRYDFRLLLPKSSITGGRPSWIWSMDKKPVKLQLDKLKKLTYPLLLEAYLINESEQTVPIDRIEMKTKGSKRLFALKKGKYKIKITTANNEVFILKHTEN